MAYDRKVQGAAEGSRQQGLAQAKMLGAALARQKGQEETETTRHPLQQISLTLVRGNSTLLVGRSPDDDLLPAVIDSAT